jgi:hypothetical protein
MPRYSTTSTAYGGSGGPVSPVRDVSKFPRHRWIGLREQVILRPAQRPAGWVLDGNRRVNMVVN